MTAAQSTNAACGIRPGTRHIADWTVHTTRHRLRRRLIVVAPGVRGLVRDIGGWLFDRVTAGWDVTVLVPAPVDTRPLEILGAGIVDRDVVDAAKLSGPLPDEVAIAVDLFQNDARIHAGLERFFDGRHAAGTEIRLWGGPLPTAFVDDFHSEQYTISRAALAFKKHALAAASASTPPEFLDNIEHYHRSHVPADGFR